MPGIDAGYVLRDHIFTGAIGKGGEIGHTSINFAGLRCYCGNIGCLDAYANLESINIKIQQMMKTYPARSYLPANNSSYSWKDVVDAAESSDFFAISALDEFCGYISHALKNVIHLLGIDHIIVGYESSQSESVIIKALSEKLNKNENGFGTNHISIEKSIFGNEASLIGGVALITNQLFSGNWIFNSLEINPNTEAKPTK